MNMNVFGLLRIYGLRTMDRMYISEKFENGEWRYRKREDK